MAKVAKFDRQEVVEKAMNLYWQKGFLATSMRNLQEEVDLRPGSIYAAFGNKDELFKQSLKHYTENLLAQIAQCKADYKSPLAALKAFVKTQVIDSLLHAPNNLCLLVKTLSELTHEQQELLELTKSYIAVITQEFEQLIQSAQTLGEISTQQRAVELAAHLQIQIAGLRTFAKVNNDPAFLTEKIEEIFHHYPFQTV
jgi:AcrR family transcriptional regulator